MVDRSKRLVVRSILHGHQAVDAQIAAGSDVVSDTDLSSTQCLGHPGNNCSIEDNSSCPIDRLGSLARISLLDGIKGDILQLRLHKESRDRTNIGDLGCQLQIVDTTGILVGSFVEIISSVVGEGHDYGLDTLFDPIHMRGLQEVCDAVQNLRRNVGERIDALRTCSSFGDVDSQECLAEVVGDERTQMLDGLAGGGFAVHYAERTEIRLVLGEVLVRLGPQGLHDERISSNRQRHGEKISIGDGADHIRDSRDGEELNSLVGILRIKDAGISSNSEEGTLFGNLLSIRRGGQNFNADQNTDVVACGNRMRGHLCNKVANHLRVGDDRELGTSQTIYSHGGCCISQHLEEVRDKRSHLLDSGIIELGNHYCLLNINGSIDCFSLDFHIVRPHSRRSIVDGGVALVEEQVDGIATCVVDNTNCFDLVVIEALDADAFLSVGEDALHVFDVVATFFTKTAS